MMSTPEVSVVMSVYNGAQSLVRTLDSILAQQAVELELIVIDDGCDDGSGRLLDELAARHPRMRVVHQDNTGLTRALIRGCGMARGAFIARHDAGGDVLWIPEREGHEHAADAPKVDCREEVLKVESEDPVLARVDMGV